MLPRPLPVVGAEPNVLLAARQLDLFLGGLRADGGAGPLDGRGPTPDEVDRYLAGPQ